MKTTNQPIRDSRISRGIPAARAYIWVAACSLMILTVLAGCRALPIEEAFTPSQRAYAVAGMYQIAQSRALDALARPELPESAREAIKRADAVAAPVIVGLIQAIRLYSDIQAELGDTQGDARLAAAAANLEDWLLRAKPLVDDFTKTLERT